MKFIALTLMMSFSVFAADECLAPESVKKVAELLSKTFDGSKIACSNNTSFSSKFNYECKGDTFVSSPDDPAVVTSGDKVHVVSVLSEEKGRVVMTEYTYSSKEGYEKGEKPSKVLPTQFIALSDKSFSFYSNVPPAGKSWIQSVWFIAEGETKARGYKLFVDKAVDCAAE